MIQIRELNDKRVWNSFLYNFPKLDNKIPRTTFIQSYEWIEFNNKLENNALPLAFYKDNNLVGIAAAIFIKAKRGKYFYIRNGPLLDWENKELVDECIKKLKEYAKQKGAWFIRISPLVEQESLGAKYLNQKGFVDCPMHDVEALDTWLMDISDDEETLFNAIKKKTRYLIRKGLDASDKGFNLTTEVSTKTEDVERFYKILSDTVKRHKWSVVSLNYIKNEFSTFAKENKAFMIFVKKGKEDIACGMFITTASQAFYHYGASLSKYNKIPGPYVMIWEAIKESKKRDCTFFSFWGIAPENKPNHPWQGLTTFKMKFPGFAQRWEHSKDIPISPVYWATNICDRIDKKRKGY